jgi:hypothetical protein
MPRTMKGVALALVVIGYPLCGAAQESIADFMARYELALDRGDTALLRDVYAEWTEERATKLAHYFRDVIAEHNVEDRARVRFLRRDRFTDQETGERLEKSIRLEKALLLRDGHWLVTRVTD